MFNPVATYRIQFHKEFTFKQFEQIIPYLHKLGVSTIYASPVFEAAPGSNHGYDVVNPHRINPEIGTLEELKGISQKLKELNINWLQDIVPNHMAFHQNNAWLMDVMEKGQKSEYADFFDIIWNVAEFDGRLMVPFLGSPLHDVIANKELTFTYLNGKFQLQYGEQTYPVNIKSYATVFENIGAEQPENIRKELAKIDNTDIDDLPLALSAIANKANGNSFIDTVVNEVNKQPVLLQKIADEQFYKLCFWRESEQHINYRRFFTVNSLICLNIHHQKVFDYYHQFIKQLLDEGVIQGVRVDHIDGLYDPAGYLQNLRALTGDEAYIVVEKILEQGEEFPADWPVQGNTGYDFLAIINNLFTSTKGKKNFTDFYKTLTDNKQSVNKSILEKKADILYQHMAGELENLYRLFLELKLVKDNELEKTGAYELKTAIGEFLIRCPVYRYYGNSLPLNVDERNAIESIFTSVNKNKPELENAVQLLRNVLLKPNSNVDYRSRALRFYQRCMQFSGPLMAKGVEDTLMYTYDRFIGHNEVGDSPEAFGIKVAQFHDMMIDRQQNWPLSINATSTHDTKRGEDVRARLNVLSDSADIWIETVKQWQNINAGLKQNNAPDANDEYLIYQTLTGFYPFPGEDSSDVADRLQAYLTKALREAKTHTQWAEPDEAYEKGTLEFAAKLLDSKTDFFKSFTNLENQLADSTIINSLAQVLLKFTCPGVPDVYQGCEMWDMSLVDPDNRRPVDYDAREKYLEDPDDLKSLWTDRHNGKVKLWLTQQLLQLRKSNSLLFEKGIYVPLQITGKYRNDIIAFARQYLREWVIMIAPLSVASLTNENITEHNWDDTAIVIPNDAPLEWQNILDKQSSVVNDKLTVKELFTALPLGVLRSVKPSNNRSAGVILHITSLPSVFGVGDMGPEARSFAGFLSRSHQKYWQLLPLNPISKGASYSPYSSFSSMAGNTLLISPDDLVADGLLNSQDLKAYKRPSNYTVNYDVAETIKKELLNTAFDRYQQSDNSDLRNAYTDFEKKEAYWLDDFALYEVLKSYHNGEPWYNWPDIYKRRDKAALKNFIADQQLDLQRSKWQQFIFFKQWSALRKYGNELGVEFFGDLPFYISYDSVDVWTYPNLFKLDDNKSPKKVAGVPPDYFNASGQLWGMPVYDWENLAATNYKWWVDRIKKNKEFFDVIRLDHFRAFYDFWEVDATETTAINGVWKPGPGTALFKVLNDELGDLPFIAEDLGDVNPGVYGLRDELKLPGMNLLHYAFSTDMPISIHIPHNHIKNSVTYTGTHDNNTTIGWFANDVDKETRDNLERYTKVKLSKRNVNDVLIEVCYSSVSTIAIVPLQDVLGLDERCRMNSPSSQDGNWVWQLKPGQLTGKFEQKLQQLVKLYNR